MFGHLFADGHLQLTKLSRLDEKCYFLTYLLFVILPHRLNDTYTMFKNNKKYLKYDISKYVQYTSIIIDIFTEYFLLSRELIFFLMQTTMTRTHSKFISATITKWLVCWHIGYVITP